MALALGRYLSRRGAAGLTRHLLLRARFSTALAMSPLRRRLDLVRHPGLRYLELDVPRINAALPMARRAEIARVIVDVLADTDRVDYFRNLSRYNWRHRHLPPGIPALDDVYPPNLAVLDFLDRYVNRRETPVLLDFACGIGTLLVYERDLGFTQSYGYDQWSYLAQSTAARFLAHFGLDASVLLSADEVSRLPVTIVTCVGYPLTLLLQTSDVLNKPSVRWVLADRMGRPDTLPGFRRTGEYEAMLTVFER
jgi:hypothetical protein